MAERQESNYFHADAMDDYLFSLGIFRKTVATDETSLFRAASEQIYATQTYHADLQDCCDKYIGRNPEKFENFTQVQSYVRALAILYKHDFLIYQEISKPPVNVTNFGYSKKVILCESFGNHFDCVYPRPFQRKAAICQSLVYEMLYKGAFHMDTKVDAAVGLVRRHAAMRHRHQSQQYGPPNPIPASLPPQNLTMPPPMSPQQLGQCSYAAETFSQVAPFCGYMEMNVSVASPIVGTQPINNAGGADYGQNRVGTLQPSGMIGGMSRAAYYLGAPATIVRRSIMRVSPMQSEAVRAMETEMETTGPPFPYKVAKALDPVIYRNVEYDIWLEDKKARYRSVHGLLSSFPIGTKCLVHLDNGDFCGVVQEVDSSGTLVTVYLPRSGERKTVQLDRIEPCRRGFEPQFDSVDATPVAQQVTPLPPPLPPTIVQQPPTYPYQGPFFAFMPSGTVPSQPAMPYAPTGAVYTTYNYTIPPTTIEASAVPPSYPFPTGYGHQVHFDYPAPPVQQPMYGAPLSTPHAYSMVISVPPPAQVAPFTSYPPPGYAGLPPPSLPPPSHLSNFHYIHE